MARTDPHFRLRFPDALRQKVEAAAEESHRSMTAEIIARLEASFPAEELALTPSEVVDAIMEYDKRIDALEAWVKKLRERTGDDVYNSWKD